MNEYMRQRQEHINKGRPLAEKKKHVIAKVSPKRQAKLDEQKLAGTDNEMDLFFKSQRKKLTNRCLFCGAKTMKDDDEKFHFSIAHLLPKRPVNKGGFPSVGTHEDNWIELCFWGENCHGNFDSGQITWEFIFDSKEGEIIREKLLTVLPLVSEDEKKHKLYSKLINLVYGKAKINKL